MTRPLLIADCYLDPDNGGTPALAALLRDHPWESVRAPYDPLPPSLAPYAGLVISGSAATVSPPPPWAQSLMSLVREARAERIPTLGVCFGHQLIAAAISGPAATGRAPVPEVGAVSIDVLADDPLFDGISAPFTCFVSHGDEVRSHALGLRILARSEGCGVQALRIPEAPMWGVQFHAEMPREERTRLVKWRALEHPELELDVEQLLARDVDTSALAQRLFDNFLREVGVSEGYR